MNDVYVVGAKRTPIGAFLGGLGPESAPRLGSVAIVGALEHAAAPAEAVDAVLMGQALTAGAGQAPARQAAIFAGLGESIPCVTVNKVCGSGMQTVIQGFNEISLGVRKVAVAGGMESMSRAPYLLDRARTGYRLGNGEVIDSLLHDGLMDVYQNIHAGNCAELCAREKSISREDQDAFAAESYRRAQRSMEQGRAAKEISPVTIKGRKGDTVVGADEEPGKVNFDKLPTLKPAFENDGTVTAANASTLNDGAAALVLASGESVKEHGWKPLVKICGWNEFASAPEWFTTAPIGASKRLLDSLGWNASQIDVWEVNEAFSVVALAVQRGLGIPAENLNPRGGAVAIGHPIGASGARILVTLIHEMLEQRAKRGVGTICIGGGEALAIGLELC